jgi:5-methylcytosine-specific restriction protein B
MNYWHMQLEPGDDKLGYTKVKEILIHNIIGMGTWDEKSSQQNDFQKRMNIGDIVLIKSGQTVIALVQITSDYFENDNDNFWFNRRRGVKILELLEEPKKDFPQPMGTLNIASNKNTDTYKYIDSWYKRYLIVQEKFNIFKLLILQKKFQEMKEDNNKLFHYVNSIDKSDLRQLSYIYESIENLNKKPVVLLRKKIIDELLMNNNISSDTVKQLKEKLSKNFEKNVYKSWKEDFRILYSLVLAKYKNEIEKYIERFIKIVQNKLNIKEYTKFKYVHFDGAQNQGNDTIWFAIYNDTYKKQLHANQLLFSIENGKFKYGFFHNDRKDEDKRIERESLCLKELIDTYQKYIELIKNDNSKEKAMLAEKTDLLEYQKQIILQGPPGTGKTRLAKQMARYIIKGETEVNIDDMTEQVKLIQFHPSYSYEDFVRGIVADSSSGSITYKTENKVLAAMAKQAKEDLEKNGEYANKYILIIDEINRANLSSVLGELIYALEYRDEAVESMYELEGSRKIILPSNLYIIGTMNTADRSIGHIDYAIRRRFTFVDVLSNENNILDAFPEGKKLYEETIKLFTDDYVSPEFNVEDIKIGHSYFIAKDVEELKNKLEYQVKPLLREYIKDGVLNENAREKVQELKFESNS